ncbi:MAG: energy-coupling factor transporter transmembrane protein EcfT [Treponema sp.]|nr:energy-coupling factor transporter transmembrane protein EcfT [Treponema sp.]
MALSPWSYRSRSSPLHKAPAGLKLLALLALSLGAFVQNLLVLGGIILIILGLSLVARLGPRELLRGSRPLLVLSLGVLSLGALETRPLGLSIPGLIEGALFCLRLLAAYGAGSLLFAVTTTGELRRSLSRLEGALGLSKLRMGLHLALMLGFIPRFFQVWDELNLAWKARGGGRNIRRIFVLIPLAMEGMINKAAETAAALQSRLP